MKKIISCVLCSVFLLSVPAFAKEKPTITNTELKSGVVKETEKNGSKTLSLFLFKSKPVAVVFAGFPAGRGGLLIGSLEGLTGTLKALSKTHTKYAIIISKMTVENGSISGVVYQPTRFPVGFSVKDLKND